MGQPWALGGRPQRARHTKAARSGTDMSPCPRGLRRGQQRVDDEADDVGAVLSGNMVMAVRAEDAKPV
jgi:hypothetical protein